MPKVSYSSRPLPGYPGNLVPCSLLSGWSPSWESSSGKGTAGSIRKLAFLFNLATETTTQSGHISNRNVFVWLFSVPNSERNIRLPGLSCRRPGRLCRWVGALYESWTRPSNLRVSLYLVIYDSGKVSLEHLLISRHPSQSPLSQPTLNPSPQIKRGSRAQPRTNLGRDPEKTSSIEGSIGLERAAGAWGLIGFWLLEGQALLGYLAHKKTPYSRTLH